MKKRYTKGLVVFSGGQDSTTCLGVALDECESVSLIAFDYGQRHSVEIAQARIIANYFDCDLKVVDARAVLGIMTSALTGEGDVSSAHPHNSELPASFVPNRNALFLTIAHGYAQELSAQVIYTGVCQTDYSGYPDCREVFVVQFEHALNLGYQTGIKIETPLMHLNKAETFLLAHEMGILKEVVNMSHTCYEGDRTLFHDWGFGCGECPACELRAKGWEEFKDQYPDNYASHIEK